MKPCRQCEYHIPDHADNCPHCRHKARRGEFLPQLLLVAASAAAAVAILAEGCPVSLGAGAGPAAPSLRVELNDQPAIHRLAHPPDARPE